MNKGLLESQWQEYRSKVISKRAPEVQVTESKRAFFAGAWAFYAVLMNNVGPEPQETREDLSLMEGLHTEMVAFAEACKAGKA